MWDLIVSVPDHCLSFYFTTNIVRSTGNVECSKAYIQANRQSRIVFNHGFKL